MEEFIIYIYGDMGKVPLQKAKLYDYLLVADANSLKKMKAIFPAEVTIVEIYARSSVPGLEEYKTTLK